MKTSNKILWGSFAGVLVTSIIFLVVLRVLFIQPIEPGDEPARSTAMGSREITMSSFVALNLQGHWRAELSQGDTTKIRVEGPEDLLETLSVKMEGESLTLRMAKQHKGERKLLLSATMPEMNRLQAKGVVDVSMKRFEMERLIISAEGVSTIRGSEGRVGALDLRGRGVSNVELEKNPVGTAVLDYEGVFNIDLTMDGGELAGSIKGVGKVRYGGKISRESIRQKGPCKVIRKSDANQV